MSQNFNDMFEGLRSNIPRTTNNNEHYKTFETLGHVRNLCFTRDNDKRFMNYAYLVDVELSEESSIITLNYTSKTVILKGDRLEILFNDLLFHLPLEVKTITERYTSTVDAKTFYVTSIEFIGR